MNNKIEPARTKGYARSCREVICPFCNHRFMWLSSVETPLPTYYYRNKETNEAVNDTICPKCGEEVILEPHVLLGIVPCEEKYDKIGFRGI